MIGDGDRVTELDLLAYVDGHLDPARQRIVEAYLATHPEDAKRVAADLAINDGIRRLFQDDFLEAPPPRLASLLNGRRRTVPISMAAAAALAFGLAGLGGGWWAGRTEAPVAPPVRHAAEAARTVAADGESDAIRWLAAHVGGSIRLPDLRSAGFRLVQQSVVGGPGKPTVQLTFADERNQRIDLFLQPRIDDAKFRYEESDARGLLSWTNGPVVFALTGDLPADQLQTLAEIVHSTAHAAPDPGPGRAGASAAAPVPAGILPVASGIAH